MPISNYTFAGEISVVKACEIGEAPKEDPKKAVKQFELVKITYSGKHYLIYSGEPDWSSHMTNILRRLNGAEERVFLDAIPKFK